MRVSLSNELARGRVERFKHERRAAELDGRIEPGRAAGGEQRETPLKLLIAGQQQKGRLSRPLSCGMQRYFFGAVLAPAPPFAPQHPDASAGRTRRGCGIRVRDRPSARASAPCRRRSARRRRRARAASARSARRSFRSSLSLPSNSRSSATGIGLPRELRLLLLELLAALRELLRVGHATIRSARRSCPSARLRARSISLSVVYDEISARSRRAISSFAFAVSCRFSSSASRARICSGVAAGSIFFTGRACLSSTVLPLLTASGRNLVGVVDNTLLVDPFVGRRARAASASRRWRARAQRQAPESRRRARSRVARGTRRRGASTAGASLDLPQGRVRSHVLQPSSLSRRRTPHDTPRSAPRGRSSSGRRATNAITSSSVAIATTGMPNCACNSCTADVSPCPRSFRSSAISTADGLARPARGSVSIDSRFDVRRR